MKSFRQVADAGENTLISHLLSEERKRKRERLCPKGHHYNRNTKRCEPNTSKDDVRLNKSGRDAHPANGAGYRTWGKTGINGDGYAWAEPNGWGDDAGGMSSAGEGHSGCSSCSEEAQPYSASNDPYRKAQKKSTKQADRRAVSSYRIDNKRKGAQNKGMSVHEDILALRLEAKRAKDLAPTEKLEIPTTPESTAFNPSPVHRTELISKGRSKGTRKPLTLNPKAMKESSVGCPRCGATKCRCLGNQALIDSF